MKFSKGILALGFAFSGAAMAQDAAPAVSAQNQAPLKSLLPGFYGKVELRHDTIRAEDESGDAVKAPAAVYVRPTLGTTLFDGKLDTAFTWSFKHGSDDNTFKKSDVYNETQWNVIEGKFGNNDSGSYTFAPYAYTDFAGAAAGSFWFSDIGIYSEVTDELPIPSGALALNAYLNPMGEFIGNQYSKDNKVGVENRTDKGAAELGLTADDSGNPTTQQRDPSIVNLSGLGVKYKPAAVKGLSVGLGLDYIQTWAPVYEVKPTEEDAGHIEMDHYSAQSVTMNRVILSYKLTDKVTLTNQVRYFVGGFNQRGISTTNPDRTLDSQGVGPYSFENRLQLTATLF